VTRARGRLVYGCYVVGGAFTALLLTGRAQAFWQLYAAYAVGVGLGTGFLLVPNVGG
jgi:hypothetical protein